MHYYGNMTVVFLILVTLLMPRISFSAGFEVCGPEKAYPHMATGYVVTDIRKNTSAFKKCSSGWYKLEKPSDGGTACSKVYNGSNVVPGSKRITTLPPGWYVSKTGSTFSKCDGDPYLKITDNPTSDSLICSIRGVVPDGFVTTSDTITNSSIMNQCNDFVDRKIKKISKPLPNGTTVVCRDNSIPYNVLPKNYVVSEKNTRASNSCSNGYYKIKKPLINKIDYACFGDAYTKIPHGFSVLSQKTNDSICGGLTRVKIYSGFQHNGVVCSVANLPANKVVTQVLPKSIGCSGKAYRIANVSSRIRICSYDNKGYKVVPPGYVVTKIENTDRCGAYGKEYTIKLPKETSFFCAASLTNAYNAIPSGYGVTNFDHRHECLNNGKNAVDFKEYSADNEYCRQSTFDLNKAYPDSVPSLPKSLVITRTRDDSRSACEKILVTKPEVIGKTNVCAANFPPGYLWVEGYGAGKYNQCKSRNGYTITKPVNDNYWLCYGGTTYPATLLSSYAIVGTKNTQACGFKAPYNVAYEVEKIQGDGPHTICNQMGVPDGYIVTDVISNSACKNIFGSNQGLRIQRPSSMTGNIVQCLAYNSLAATPTTYYEQIPEGYVAIAISPYSQCNAAQGKTGYGFTIARPENIKSRVICNIPGFKLPAGYVPDGADFKHNACGLYRGIKIKPDVEIPKDFINIPANVLPNSPPTISFPCIAGGNTSLVSGAQANSASCQANMPIK